MSPAGDARPGSRGAHRVLLAFLPLVAIEGYWATYSAGVVSATSMDSVWPPIHCLFTLALLAGFAVPVHRAVRQGSAWARLLAAISLWVVLAGICGAVSNSWVGHPLADSFVGDSATALTALLWLPVQSLLQKVAPFDTRELVVLYVLLTTGSLVMGFGAAHFVLPAMMAPRYFATASNHWETQIFPHLPLWLFPLHAGMAKDFYVGHRTSVPWRPWLLPLTLWTIYVVLIVTAMLGLNGLVRRLWIQNERLTFPQVFLPLELARQEGGSILNSFFRSPAMWGGFTVAALLELMSGIHIYFPSSPAFQFRNINALEGIDASPWNSIGGLTLNFYPCIVGLTYLLVTEVSFSTWFFYLIRKFLPAFGVQMGWQDAVTQDGTRFPFPDQVSTGAFLAVALLAMWALARLWRGARERGENLDLPARERIALIGGFCGALLWSRLLGISVVVMTGFLGAFFLGSLAYTRIRAETGIGGLTGPMPPQDALVTSFGPASFRPHDLVGLGALRWSSWDLRFLPSEMPAQLEGYKLGDSVGLSPVWLFWALLFSVVVGLVLSYVLELPIIYDIGANQMNEMRYHGTQIDTLKNVSRWISTPKPSDNLAVSAGSAGMIVTLLLGALRSRFFGFPFHPLGFAIGFSRRTIDWMWFSIFLGWCCKVTVLRIGGLDIYRRLLPFFLGLLLGDFCMGGVFGFLGCIFPQTAGYQVYP